MLEQLLRLRGERLGFVFRHYHLSPTARRDRFDTLRVLCNRHGHTVVIADSAAMAHAWGADGVYGPGAALPPPAGRLLRIATAHDMAEIATANHVRADAIMLSPVFPTRSHPGARTLGPARFRTLARHAAMPVIALGGMDARRARRLQCDRWAAIDGFSNAVRRSRA